VGYSGGTWLGAYYATYFPNRVGRFVLDANAEFTARWQKVFGNQPLGFQRRFEVDFLSYVAAHDDYFHLGASAVEVNQAYEGLRSQLAAEPLDLDEGVTVYPADLDLLISGAMYSKTYFQGAAEEIRALADLAARRTPAAGDVRAQQRRKIMAERVRRARELDRFHGHLPLAPDAYDPTFLQIICNDTPWQGDRQSQLADSLAAGQSYPPRGWYALGDPCLSWRRPAVDLVTPTGEGLPPVLMVQTGRDPATPVEGAVAAEAAFAPARMLRVTDEGDHGSYALDGNECVDGIVEAYLVDGLVPDENSTCPGQPIPDPVPLSEEPRGLVDLLDHALGTAADRVARLTRLLGPLPI